MIARLLRIVLLMLSLPAAAGEVISADAFDPGGYDRARLIYLDFWASWCVPCRKSFPWLNDMQARYGDQGLVVVGVNLDARREDADLFLASYPASFALVMDPSGTLGERYQLQGMPSAVLLDADGNELHRHIGFRADKTNEYEALLKTLLKEAGQ